MVERQQKGVLYVVGTPIGNLEDITYRAVRILREADLVACEDTRQTRKLLDRYGIAAETLSYHEHNERERAEELAAKLDQGTTIAVVSDAGMPGISDPGYRLVKLANERGISVVPVPGPSALIAALAAGGLPTDAFEFRGFLPVRSGERRTLLESLRDAEHTVAVYETPHRIREALEDIVEILGAERPVVIARELTKVHEEFIRGSSAEALREAQQRELKGEITLLIGKGHCRQRTELKKSLAVRLKEIMQERNLDEKTALKALAKETGMTRSEVYREVQREEASKKR